MQGQWVPEWRFQPYNDQQRLEIGMVSHNWSPNTPTTYGSFSGYNSGFDNNSRRGRRFRGRNVYDERQSYNHKKHSGTFDSNGYWKHQKALARARYKLDNRKPQQHQDVQHQSCERNSGTSEASFGNKVKNN